MKIHPKNSVFRLRCTSWISRAEMTAVITQTNLPYVHIKALCLPPYAELSIHGFREYAEVGKRLREVLHTYERSEITQICAKSGFSVGKRNVDLRKFWWMRGLWRREKGSFGTFLKREVVNGSKRYERNVEFLSRGKTIFENVSSLLCCCNVKAFCFLTESLVTSFIFQ